MRPQMTRGIPLKDKAEHEKGKKLTATDEQYKRKIEQLLSEKFAVALHETSALSKEQLYSALSS